MNTKNIQTAFTALIVAVILIGIVFTVISKASAEVLTFTPDQGFNVVPEQVKVAVAEAVAAVKADEASEGVPVPSPPLKRICEVSVKGESSWSLSILAAAAEKIEGCTVTLDLTAKPPS